MPAGGQRWPTRRLLARLVASRYFLAACLAAALVLRLSWIAFLDTQPVSDSRWYYERGIDLAAGRGYSVGAGDYWPENLPPADLTPAEDYPAGRRPTAYWPVGYPALLGLLFAVWGPSLLAAKLANVFLYLGALMLAYLLARRLFHSEAAGRITGLMLALYPNHIAYGALLTSESLFLFLLLLAVTALVLPRPGVRSAVAAGLAFGLASLVKPQVVLLPGVLLAARAITQPRFKRLARHAGYAALLYLALLLTLTPWTIRNYRVFGAFVFVSNNGGINLLVGNNPYASGGYGHDRQMAAMLSDVPEEHARDSQARDLAVSYGLEHPWQTLALWPRKLWYLYRKDVEGISWNERGLRGAGSVMLVWKGVAQSYYVIVLSAFFVSIGLLRRHQRLPALGLVIVLYFTGVYLVTFADTRFHFPAMPWLVMYPAAAVAIRAEHTKTAASLRTSNSGE
jgi:4-amino-4-deoxy-L-arabinose transferase-like glycosyltransferase